jgi:hypothetical protein
MKYACTREQNGKTKACKKDELGVEKYRCEEELWRSGAALGHITV